MADSYQPPLYVKSVYRKYRHRLSGRNKVRSAENERVTVAGGAHSFIVDCNMLAILVPDLEVVDDEHA